MRDGTENSLPTRRDAPRDEKGGDTPRAFLFLLSRRFGFMLCAQWGSGLLAGVFLVLLARLGPERFGLFSLALALGVLVTMLTGAGIENYLVPLLSGSRAPMRRVLGQALRIQFVLLLASLLLLALLCFGLGYASGKTLLIMLIAAGLGPAAMAQSFFVLCRVKGRQDTEMRIRIAAALAGNCFGIVCVLAEAPLPLIACFKLVESLALWLLIGMALHWRFGGGGENARRWLGRWRHGFLFAGISICGLLYNKLNLYLLDHFADSRALGLYNAPWEIVDGLSILISGALIEKVMFPLMAGQWRKDPRAFMRFNRITVQCLLLLGLVSSYVLYVEADRLLAFLFGGEYRASQALLHAQLPCIAAAFLHNLAACMLVSMQRYKQVFLAYLSGLAVNIVLCGLLIPEHGALGAAWAISGTKVWMMAVTVGLAVMHGLELRAGHVCAAAVAGLLAWLLYALLAPILPRETAELSGLLPLIGLALLWLPPFFRTRAENGSDGSGV